MKNMKFKRPTAEEAAEGHGYTPAEQELIDATRLSLRVCELALHDCNRAWRALIGLNLQNNVMRSHQLVVRAKWNRLVARKNLRTAQNNYWEAVHPRRLRFYRMGKIMGGYIKERLEGPSFAEKILAPVALSSGNRHERRAAEAKARKKG